MVRQLTQFQDQTIPYARTCCIKDEGRHVPLLQYTDRPASSISLFPCQKSVCHFLDQGNADNTSMNLPTGASCWFPFCLYGHFYQLCSTSLPNWKEAIPPILLEGNFQDRAVRAEVHHRSLL